VSDDVIVMNGGHVIERGLPQAIYTYPQDQFTARFLGVSNDLAGTVESVNGDGALITFGALSMRCSNAGSAEKGDEVSVFMRPESFRLSRRQHSADAWQGTIEFSIYHGDCWDYHVRIGEQMLKVRVYQEKVGIAHGDPVFVEPDCDSAIVMTGGRSDRTEDDEPAADVVDPPVPATTAALPRP
jgi:iron(III) transport system ATP-binding protein